MSDGGMLLQKDNENLKSSSFDSQSWGNQSARDCPLAPDKTNNPQEEFEFTPSGEGCDDESGSESKNEPNMVAINNMYDFKSVIQQAACKGE